MYYVSLYKILIKVSFDVSYLQAKSNKLVTCLHIRLRLGSDGTCVRLRLGLIWSVVVWLIDELLTYVKFFSSEPCPKAVVGRRRRADRANPCTNWILFIIGTYLAFYLTMPKPHAHNYVTLRIVFDLFICVKSVNIPKLQCYVFDISSRYFLGNPSVLL